MPTSVFFKTQIRCFPHILCCIVLLLTSVFLIDPPHADAAQVTLAWDANTEPFLSGYKIYYGTASRNYAFSETAGHQTEYVVTGLTPGKTYYFAATAFDTYGNESGYSAEVVYTVPETAAQADLQISVDSDADGITDADETRLYGTDPQAADSDGDGITDGEELAYWGENWNSALDGGGTNKLLDSDSDGDGKSDGWEIDSGFDPADPLDNGSTVYETAEHGTTHGWDIFDATPAGAVIRNVFDVQRQSRVIQLSGRSTSNGYRLRNADGSLWKNTSQFFMEWSMNFSESFMIYIDVNTSAGHRYLVYQAIDSNVLGKGEYVLHGLGRSAMGGGWRTFSRDLQGDLEEAQPGVKILEVNGMIIRGSGMVDDVKLVEVGGEL
ncbi:MAG: fibronectin type III domain-containing protein [Pseudomonadota bacterium]